MHSHSDTVPVNARFCQQADEAQYAAATTHLPKNTGGAPLDVILVELKRHSAKPHKAKME